MEVRPAFQVVFSILYTMVWARTPASSITTQIRKLATEHRPKMIVAGASAYPRRIDFELLAEIAASVEALFMVDMAHIAGSGSRGCAPLADTLCRRGDLDHPQDTQGPPRRTDPVQIRAC